MDNTLDLSVSSLRAHQRLSCVISSPGLPDVDTKSAASHCSSAADASPALEDPPVVSPVPQAFDLHSAAVAAAFAQPSSSRSTCDEQRLQECTRSIQLVRDWQSRNLELSRQVTPPPERPPLTHSQKIRLQAQFRVGVPFPDTHNHPITFLDTRPWRKPLEQPPVLPVHVPAAPGTQKKKKAPQEIVEPFIPAQVSLPAAGSSRVIPLTLSIITTSRVAGALRQVDLLLYPRYAKKLDQNTLQRIRDLSARLADIKQKVANFELPHVEQRAVAQLVEEIGRRKHQGGSTVAIARDILKLADTYLPRL